ncbi:MAG: Na+/H+ antiporter NhaC family protein [Rhodothermales bacterium]
MQRASFVFYRLLAGFFFFAITVSPAQAQDAAALQAPQAVLSGIPFTVEVDAEVADGALVRVAGREYALTLDPDAASAVSDPITLDSGGMVSIALVRDGAVIQSMEKRVIPGWLAIVPPLLAILIALIFKRVIPALFLGIWVGSWAAAGLSFAGIFTGLLDTVQVYVLHALADTDHASIIIFTLMIGGMVGIISRNGGTQGIVNGIVSWAKSAQRGQVATWVLGMVIFFDDYANTLVVGKTMRPVTDSLKISREKLAYIVDSTAAPVASIALATTWIGYEVGLIGDSVSQIDGFSESAYSIFLNSLGYSFYPILAIYFVLMVALLRRDFGPMYRAERRARTTGAVSPVAESATAQDDETREIAPIPGKPQRAFNAIIPVTVLILGVLVGLYTTGEGETLRDIIGSADSYKSLMGGSLAGVLAAILLSVVQRILTLEQTIEAWYAGLKSMMFAMIILLMAWALSSVTEVLHTAEFLVSILGDALAPGFIPALVFLLAAATGFATGSSWGAMGILMPLVLPLAWAVLQVNGMSDPQHFYVIYSTVACVLAGSVWGDHCSPISDTTILSSMASSCDHIEHVRTQLPYALTVGLVAVMIGTIPTGFGLPWWVAQLGGAVILFLILRYVGKEVDAPQTRAGAA